MPGCKWGVEFLSGAGVGTGFLWSGGREGGRKEGIPQGSDRFPLPLLTCGDKILAFK